MQIKGFKYTIFGTHQLILKYNIISLIFKNKEDVSLKLVTLGLKIYLADAA
jgi:hypothetical protein